MQTLSRSASMAPRPPYNVVAPAPFAGEPGAPIVPREYKPPVVQLDVSGSAGGPHSTTGSAATANAPVTAKPLAIVHYGFTPQQKVTVRAQIMAIKILKRQDGELSPDDWEKAKPTPLTAALAAEMPAAVALQRWLDTAQASDSEALKEIALCAAGPQALAAEPASKGGSAAAAPAEDTKQTRGTRVEPAAQRKGATRATADTGRGAGDKAAAGGARARNPAEEAAARRRAQVAAAHPTVWRTWPQALYWYDAFPRNMPKPVQFEVKARLPDLLQAERARMLNRVQDRVRQRIETRLQHSDTSNSERASLLLWQRKLRLLPLQRRVRAAVEARQQTILMMQDRNYKKFQADVRRTLAQEEREAQEKHTALWGQRLAAVKDVRSAISIKTATFKEVKTVMNRAVVKAHERMAREADKGAGDDREARMRALKAKDFAAYQAMLKVTAGAAAAQDERYAEITAFLSETEDYLNKLTAKILEAKVNEDREKAYTAALAEARENGLSEEAAHQSALLAANEAAETSEFVRLNETMAGDAQARYIEMAHAVQEDVKPPKMLKGPGGAQLREYQKVGLRWMVSLYNNNLNGILADEMGLGKTVQVMALIAHLMEEKSNFGPHLIVVPNAVLVNWKSELHLWLPDCKCVYYTGTVSERKAKFKELVEVVQFNCLVTTYEYVLRDASQLSKVAWKYLVIDEAQRMKDRESKLAKAFDKFVFDKRLLLTGTPLQNELRELWSLLNLLLPELFNDKAQFARWFGDALAKMDKTGDAEDELINNEKRVVVVNRLHQILEPFMLRRQVQDVEGSLPEKVTITIKCPMTGYQGAIYDWVKATGLLRVDPESADAKRTGMTTKSLKNRIMELRKICNHPLLTYPPHGHELAMLKAWFDVDERIVAECGKMQYVDRLFVKFKRTGHRVLLFSTMTKVLDLMELYLRWRKIDGECLQYRRIDGSSSLEDRETAIRDFNAPGSQVFIFLLSIRAAGRGLNLQTSDTVIMYDPDANPKNEEQAVARSHRIGQKKPVRVIHLETVADAPPDAVQNDDPEYDVEATGGDTDAEAAARAAAAAASTKKGIGAVAAAASDLTRNTTKYLDSVESVYRHVIQKQKNDMAAEIIDAGRFDQHTTNEERRETLEQILADTDRNKIAKNEVPTWEWINRRLARTREELTIFERIDADESWIPPRSLEEAPAWVRFTAEEVTRAVPQKRRRRGEADLPQMVGPEWNANQATFDSSGRSVRKASVAASQAIAQHAHWVHHNPYRVAGDDGAGAAAREDEDDGDEEAAQAMARPGGAGGAGETGAEAGGSRKEVSEGRKSSSTADGANGGGGRGRPSKRRKMSNTTRSSSRRPRGTPRGEDEDDEGLSLSVDDGDMEEEDVGGNNFDDEVPSD